MPDSISFLVVKITYHHANIFHLRVEFNLMRKWLISVLRDAIFLFSIFATDSFYIFISVYIIL